MLQVGVLQVQLGFELAEEQPHPVEGCFHVLVQLLFAALDAPQGGFLHFKLVKGSFELLDFPGKFVPAFFQHFGKRVLLSVGGVMVFVVETADIAEELDGAVPVQAGVAGLPGVFPAPHSVRTAGVKLYLEINCDVASHQQIEKELR